MERFVPRLRMGTVIDLTALARNDSIMAFSKVLKIPRTTVLFWVHGTEFPKALEIGRVFKKLRNVTECFPPAAGEGSAEKEAEEIACSYAAEGALRKLLSMDAFLAAASRCAAEILRRYEHEAVPFSPPGECAGAVLRLYREGLNGGLDEKDERAFFALLSGYVFSKIASSKERCLELPRNSAWRSGKPPSLAVLVDAVAESALLPDHARLKNAILFDVLLSFARSVTIEVRQDACSASKVICVCEPVRGEPVTAEEWYVPFEWRP